MITNPSSGRLGYFAGRIAAAFLVVGPPMCAIYVGCVMRSRSIYPTAAQIWLLIILAVACLLLGTTLWYFAIRRLFAPEIRKPYRRILLGIISLPVSLGTAMGLLLLPLFPCPPPVSVMRESLPFMLVALAILAVLPHLEMEEHVRWTERRIRFLAQARQRGATP